MDHNKPADNPTRPRPLLNHTQPSLSSLLASLKRAHVSPLNRLRSVARDAGFVARAGRALGRPLVANERCGAWYVRPRDRAASAYFKSTDGHAGEWALSLRRLNLHLLDLVGECDG
jgi:tRNA A64-2'-O-ribosylphosphate transferase